MDKNLPARPNLDHLRRQAKTLLAQLAEGNAAAARAFIDHLPAARGKKPEALRTAKLRLADAQSVVARQNGFSSWPVLARHVEQLRALEGTWHFTSLEIDGAAVPAGTLGASRILIDGDRFRTESPEATYEGIFTIDTEAAPPHIDIEFISGPDAGDTCHGIYEVAGDALTICLGLVGSSRPLQLATRPGSGHALERLQRVSASRPADVKGGTPPVPPAEEAVERGDAAAFEIAMTPLLQRLQGEWAAVALVRDGKAMQADWLAYGSRTMTGNETKVVFGGQTMVHARVRIDETTTPFAIEYLALSGKKKGTITRGTFEWIGDDAQFVMGDTLSRWRRRG